MTDCLTVIGALNIAEFTGQIVKITFCIRLEECGEVKEEKIENVEYVLFS